MTTTLSKQELKEWQIYSYTKRIEETSNPVAKAFLQHQLNRINASDTQFDRNRAMADRRLSLLFRSSKTN